MTRQRHEAQFIEMVRERYHGHAKVEIIVNLSKEKTTLPVSEGARDMAIRLLLGEPKVIGDELLYPVELPMFGTYHAVSDGEMSEDAATGLMLRRALGRIFPGAAVLLKIPTFWTPGEVPRLDRRTP